MPRESFSLDANWRFHLGDILPPPVGDTKTYFRVKAGGACGAADPNFDDAEWRLVNLPHDWAVEGGFDRTANMDHGYRATGIGWYRRSFVLPREDEGRRLSIEFDGVFRNCTVWLNGHRLGRHRSGYTSFRYDITDVANYGGRNLLAVRVDASDIEGWWYEGAGIYRHVRLINTEPVHVAHWGVFVTSRVVRSAGRLTIRTRIMNGANTPARIVLFSRIVDASGRTVARVASAARIADGGEIELAQHVSVAKPKLWSVDSPHLYRLLTVIKKGGRVIDEVGTPFGIRTIRFDADKGFFLNGKPLKLKGACNHQDHAGVGIALPDRLHEFRIEQLKAMGCNAYRCAHNPTAPELLDACDRLGVLVMDENRKLDGSHEGLADLSSMILRDRNHPSIVMWSMCNEEVLMQNSDVGARIARTLIRLTRRLDPTRPTLAAINGSWDHAFGRAYDLMGCNYAISKYDDFHRNFPRQPMVVSETAAGMATRGVYQTDIGRGHVSAYDFNHPAWAHSAEESWRSVAERPFIAGAFVWTGFDYRGEPTPYRWPCISTQFGFMDTCGFPKDTYHYYKSWWSDETVLHVFPHWNWQGREGDEIAVWCFSNCDEVELFVNGRNLGRKTMPRNSHLEWQVKYAPGALSAIGSRGGKQIAKTAIETTGKPAGILLEPDRAKIRADGQDVSVVCAAIVDKQGRTVPTAMNEVRFTVTNNARILGVGNGDPSCHELDKSDRRSAFNGLCQVIIQSTTRAGAIRLTAKSSGLRAANATLNAISVPRTPSVPES